MSQLHAFERQLEEDWPGEAWRDENVLCAVSGGADSIGLLRGMLALREKGSGNFAVAHYNHRLRGDAADRDEAFVAQVAAQCAIPLEVGRAALSVDLSSEAEAREERYDFLNDAARRSGARYVVTAHTADDVAETILFRIFRGTGVAGLAGIPRLRSLSNSVTIIRPLLTTRRALIREYLTAIDQPHREDRSNQDVSFARNRLRHELIPQLEAQHNPQVVDSLVRLAAQAQEMTTLFDEQFAQFEQVGLLTRTTARVEIRRVAVQRLNPVLLREFFLRIWKQQAWPMQAMDAAKWRQLAACATAPSHEQSLLLLPGGIRAENQGELLLLTRPG